MPIHIVMADQAEVDYRFLAENSTDILCWVDQNHLMGYVSPACTSILGWSPAEMIGAAPEGFVVEEDHGLLAEATAKIGTPGVENVSLTVRMRRRHGPPVWMEINVRLARGGTRNASVSYVLVMRDVSARKELEQQLKALANTDGLTNLLNRRAFDEGVEREWKRALRDGTALSLLLLDIDHFKSFNDSYGHQAGDDCLRRVASVIMGALRVTDIVARYGGEEFVAILPSTDRNGALRAAETVRASIAALEITHLDNCEGSGRVSVSLGVASTTPAHTGRAMSAQLLLKTADNALYEAKRSGRNRIAAANVRE